MGHSFSAAFRRAQLLPALFTVVAVGLLAIRPALGHQQSTVSEDGGVQLYVTADYFTINGESDPQGTVYVGPQYDAVVNVQHFGQVCLTGTQAQVSGSFGADSTNASGDNWTLTVDQVNYCDVQGWNEELAIPRNGTAAHTKQITATTTGVSQTSVGLLAINAVDSHGIAFDEVQ